MVRKKTATKPACDKTYAIFHTMPVTPFWVAFAEEITSASTEEADSEHGGTEPVCLCDPTNETQPINPTCPLGCDYGDWASGGSTDNDSNPDDGDCGGTSRMLTFEAMELHTMEQWRTHFQQVVLVDVMELVWTKDELFCERGCCRFPGLKSRGWIMKPVCHQIKCPRSRMFEMYPGLPTDSCPCMYCVKDRLPRWVLNELGIKPNTWNKYTQT